MTGQYILSDYLDRALEQAEYDKLEDDTFFGRIPSCKGVVAFAATLRECEDELRSVIGRLGFGRLETRTRFADFGRHRFAQAG